MPAWQFILFTVIHAAGSKGLSSPDIATSSSLSTLTATEEGDCGKDNVPESHNTDGSDESDDETLVLIVFAKVEVSHRTFVAASINVAANVGFGAVGAGRVIVGRGRVGVGSGPDWDVLL